MITQPKTPTLAQLRKLAKRKGAEYVEHKYPHALYGTLSIQNRPFFNGWSWELPVREVAFAALSRPSSAPGDGEVKS